MLNILGSAQGGFCDRQSRRNFIKVGALGMGGLSLPQLLRAEREAAVKNLRNALRTLCVPPAPAEALPPGIAASIASITPLARPALRAM